MLYLTVSGLDSGNCRERDGCVDTHTYLYARRRTFSRAHITVYNSFSYPHSSNFVRDQCRALLKTLSSLPSASSTSLERTGCLANPIPNTAQQHVSQNTSRRSRHLIILFLTATDYTHCMTADWNQGVLLVLLRWKQRQSGFLAQITSLTHILSIETRINEKLSVSHTLFASLVEFCATCTTGFKSGPTAKQHIIDSRRSTRARVMVEFGTAVMFRSVWKSARFFDR